MSSRNGLTSVGLFSLSLSLHISAVAGTVEGPDALCVGEEVTYTREGLPDPISGHPYIWSSSDPSKVAVIDSDAGTFKGVALSTNKDDVTITVNDMQGNSASKSVTVVQLKRIEITAGGSGNSDDNNSAANAAPICADKPVTFRAVTENFDDVNVSGIEWSARTSGGVWQSQGTGKTRELTLAQPGNYEMKAECGSMSIVIYVVSFRVDFTITQGHGLWWFNGEDLADYDESGTLTAQGATTGTFKWDVIAGIDKVDLSKGGADADIIILTNDNTIMLKSTGASTMSNDVAVKFTYNGNEACQYKVTVRTPKEEVEISVTDHSFTWDGHANGYESRHHFKINDQFGDTLPSDVELNEKWTENAQNDHTPDTTWPQVNEDAWTVNPAGDIDFLKSCAWGDDIPNTQNPQTPLGAVEVYHWNGEHYVGSLIKGDGVKVFTKKWQYYQDHGRRE